MVITSGSLMQCPKRRASTVQIKDVYSWGNFQETDTHTRQTFQGYGWKVETGFRLNKRAQVACEIRHNTWISLPPQKKSFHPTYRSFDFNGTHDWADSHHWELWGITWRTYLDCSSSSSFADRVWKLTSSSTSFKQSFATQQRREITVTLVKTWIWYLAIAPDHNLNWFENW